MCKKKFSVERNSWKLLLGVVIDYIDKHIDNEFTPNRPIIPTQKFQKNTKFTLKQISYKHTWIQDFV